MFYDLTSDLDLPEEKFDVSGLGLIKWNPFSLTLILRLTATIAIPTLIFIKRLETVCCTQFNGLTAERIIKPYKMSGDFLSNRF